MIQGFILGRVFHYFEDFCKVPHASYHCSAAADYIKAFASKHHLRCRRDEADNVIIWKEASRGRELDKGLIGGHSGFDINRGLASSNQLMLGILKDLSAEFQFGVSFLKGGNVANAIPVEAKTTILIPKGEAKQFDKRMEHLAEQLINQWQKKEPGLQIQWQESPLSEKPDAFILSHDTLHAWESVPCGVIAMNPTLPGFVETSSSLGVITLEDGILRLIANIRSDKEEAKEAMKENSDFQQLASRVYEEIHGKKPILETIHAGLECGIFSERIPELDIISTGPDVLDGHTTHERMSISSIDRVYRFVRRILETSGR